MKLSEFFKDKHGNIAIAQRPNAPLWIAIGFYALQFVPLPLIQHFSRWGLTITLLYWAYLEIVSGDSMFRRVLGIVVGVNFLFVLFTELL